VSRGVTIFFKMVPFRVGVDEASSSFVARTSASMPHRPDVALVRKLRMAVWSAIGLALL